MNALELRPDAVVRGYWEQVTVIEETAEWLPTEHWEEIKSVQDLWDEADYRGDIDGPEILELPELVVQTARAA